MIGGSSTTKARPMGKAQAAMRGSTSPTSPRATTTPSATWKLKPMPMPRMKIGASVPVRLKRPASAKASTTSRNGTTALASRTCSHVE